MKNKKGGSFYNFKYRFLTDFVSIFQNYNMNPEFKFEGCESNHINVDRLKRTLKLVPEETRSGASVGVLNGLSEIGVAPDEVEAVYKVSAFDPSFSVMLKFSDTVELVSSKRKMQVNGNSYQIMKMNEQVVSIRVHWLPLYFDNRILHKILGQFGEVLNIKLLKTAHANVVTFDGVREVKLKVDEFQKQQLPHLVRFNSGQSILLTITGRPPYCLKCHQIGHTRQRCPGRTYAHVTANLEEARDENRALAVPAPSPAPSGSVPLSVEPTGPTDRDQTAGQGTLEQQVAMEEEGDGSLKRGRDAEVDSSWITPNRMAKSRPVPSESIPVSNPFQPVLSVDDLLAET